MGRNTKQSRSVNPADLHRKQLHKKELKKNKADRKLHRELTLTHKDTTKLERDILHYEELRRTRPLDKNQIAKLQSLQDELHHIRTVQGTPSTTISSSDQQAVQGFDKLLGRHHRDASDDESSEPHKVPYSTLSATKHYTDETPTPSPPQVAIEVENVGSLPTCPDLGTPKIMNTASNSTSDSVHPSRMQTNEHGFPPLPPGPPPLPPGPPPSRPRGMPRPPPNMRPAMPPMPPPLPPGLPPGSRPRQPPRPYPLSSNREPIRPPGFPPVRHPNEWGRPRPRPPPLHHTRPIGPVRPVGPFVRPNRPHFTPIRQPIPPRPRATAQSKADTFRSATVLSAEPVVRDLQKELTTMVPTSLLRKKRAQRKQQNVLGQPATTITTKPVLPEPKPEPESPLETLPTTFISDEEANHLGEPSPDNPLANLLAGFSSGEESGDEEASVAVDNIGIPMANASSRADSGTLTEPTSSLGPPSGRAAESNPLINPTRITQSNPLVSTLAQPDWLTKLTQPQQILPKAFEKVPSDNPQPPPKTSSATPAQPNAESGAPQGDKSGVNRQAAHSVDAEYTKFLENMQDLI